MFEYSILFVDSERILRMWRNVLLVRAGHRAREPGQHEVVRHERSQQSPEALLSQAAHLSHSRRFVQPPLGSRLVFSLSFSTRLFVRARHTLFWVGFAVIVLCCGRGKCDFASLRSALLCPDRTRTRTRTDRESRSQSLPQPVAFIRRRAAAEAEAAAEAAARRL